MYENDPIGDHPVAGAGSSWGRCIAVVARAVLVLLAGAGLAAGCLAGGDGAAAAGAALTRLLRAMAVLKAGMAVAVTGAIFWRLAVPVGAVRLAGYGLACAAMAGGVGLVWNMEYVAGGALLLHGGLIAAVLLFWRDPVVGMRLAGVLAGRRQWLGGKRI